MSTDEIRAIPLFRRRPPLTSGRAGEARRSHHGAGRQGPGPAGSARPRVLRHRRRDRRRDPGRSASWPCWAPATSSARSPSSATRTARRRSSPPRTSISRPRSARVPHHARAVSRYRVDRPLDGVAESGCGPERGRSTVTARAAPAARRRPAQMPRVQFLRVLAIVSRRIAAGRRSSRTDVPEGCYSRISIAAASRSRSMYGSPLTSTATRRIVPPVKLQGCVPG